MPYIQIHCPDACWCIKHLTDDEAHEAMERREDVHLVNARVLDAWTHHCDEVEAWKLLWQMLDSQNRREQPQEVDAIPGRFDVVFELESIGRVRRGPFGWNGAHAERAAIIHLYPDAKIVDLSTGEES